MFINHLYVQLDILQSDEKQAGFCYIVTTSAYNTILQHLLWSVVLGTWLNASLSVLPKRSNVHVRRLLLIFATILFLIFHWLTAG